MPLGYEEPWVCTFHSFADRLLKAEGIEIGIDPSYKIMPTPQQWILFRKNLFEFKLDYFRPLGNPTKFISAILRFISRLQDENISPEEFGEFAQGFNGDVQEKKRWLELAGVYKKYQDLKIEQSNMDFGDLIIWAIKLFEQRPNILKKYQDQFKHVMVDEFQDTNYAQYELVKLLCPESKLNKRSLLTVGDDSQSIYKFRGAAISNILEFKKDYKQAEMVTLVENYRSTQAILDPAYKLIQNNNPDTLEHKLKISKELVSQVSQTKPNPHALQVEMLEDEVETVIKKILEILAKETDYTYKDFAILARANNHLDPFVFALRKAGLPYQLVGNRGLYAREEVRDVIALLRTIVDPTDGINLYRVLNIDSLQVSTEVISQLLSQARKSRIDLWEVVKESKDKKISELVDVIRTYQKGTTDYSPSEFLYRVVTEINYLKPYLANETVENQLSIKNLDLFLNKAKQFEIEFQSDAKLSPTIVDFVDYVDLLIEAGDDPAQAQLQDIDTINLMTVHASKGLEFSVVFMIDLVSGRFPTRNRRDVIEVPDKIVKETLPSGNSHEQEERRLFYVGMTRARKYLFLMFAKNYGGKREKRQSGYVDETGIKITKVKQTSEDSKDQVGLFGVESGFREPKARKIGKFKPPFVSYSQIDTYKTCPLRYKYSYVLSVPQPPNHVFSFGTSIHDTLRDFHTKLMFDDVSQQNLLEIYDQNWIPVGYMNKKHAEQRFEEGKELLKDYYMKNKNLKTKPIALEKGFNIRINGTKLYGRIDRVDKLSDGGVEIIDYKTGKPKDQKAVDKDMQITIYALGVKEALGYDPKKLSFYFLENGQKITTTRDKKQIDSAKGVVSEVVDRIESGEFGANPGFHCDWCSYKEICPFARKV